MPFTSEQLSQELAKTAPNIQSPSSFIEDIEAARHRKNLAWESNIRQMIAIPTFGLSSVLLSPITSDERKAELKQYKEQHPIQTLIAGVPGLFLGGALTGGVRALLGIGKIGGISEEVLQAANALHPAEKFIKGYELLQGTREATGFIDAAKVLGIGSAMMSATDMIDTASLDPKFVAQNMSKYAGNILESGVLGAVLGAGTKGLFRSYAKVFKGEDFFESPVTTAPKEYLGTRMAEKYNKGILGDNSRLDQALNKTNRNATFFDNVNFLNDLERGLFDESARIAKEKNAVVTDKAVKDALFLAELHSSKNLPDEIAAGRLSANKIYNDWSRTVDLQKQNGIYGLHPSLTQKEIKNSLIKSVQESAVKDYHEELGKILGITTEEIQKSYGEYFSKIENNQKNSLGYLIKQQGFFDQIDSLINDVKKGKVDPLDPRAKNKNYIEAIENLAKATREDAGILNELEKRYDVVKASLLQKSVKGGYTRSLRNYVTPKLVYDTLQEFREGFNSRVAQMISKREASFGMGSPEVDQLWGQIKPIIFNSFGEMFGEFGEQAAKKSFALSDLAQQQRELMLYLTNGKMANLPDFFKERIQWEAAIHDAWGNLGKVSDFTDVTYSTPRVVGYISESKDKIGAILDNLNQVLPSEQLQVSSNRIKGFFNKLTPDEIMQTQTNRGMVDDFRILNDKHITSMFEGIEDLTKSKEGKGYHGMSNKTHITLGLKDLLLTGINPAEMRFAYTHLGRIIMNVGDNLFSKIFKNKQKQYSTMQKLIQESLQSVSELSEYQSATQRAIKGAINSIFNENTALKAGHGAVMSVASYNSRLSIEDEVRDIDRKYEKISKNVEKFLQDPEPYIEAIHASIAPLGLISQEAQRMAVDHVVTQMALAAKILPKNDSIFKDHIPTSQKAEFLDSFDALVNPELMVKKIGANTITKNQLDIFKASHDDIWDKLVQQVHSNLKNMNPSVEVKSRLYSTFGISDIEDKNITNHIAQMMLIQAQAKMKAPKAKPLKPSMPAQTRTSKMESFTSPRRYLTPQGMQNR